MAPSSPVEKFRVEYVDVSGRPQQVWMDTKEQELPNVWWHAHFLGALWEVYS